MDRKTIDEIVCRVLEQVQASAPPQQAQIPVEVSARHVHLCREDFNRLFGEGAQPEQERRLSQPGQFLCKQRVKLVTPRGCIEQVAVLGPLRDRTQVELSLTDGRTLGLNLPVNQSGDLRGAADVHIFSDKCAVFAAGSAIAARTHIHMTCGEAEKRGFCDNQAVRVRILSRRPVVFENVVVRVSDSFALAMHIDFDEANAAACQSGVTGEILSAPAVAAVRAEHKSATAEQFFSGVVSSSQVEQWAKERRGSVILSAKAVVTPLALDLCRENNIALKRDQ